MTKKILTQARLKELLHYNPKTGVFSWNFTRQRAKKGVVAGCADTTAQGKSYLRICVNGSHIRAHRLAFLYTEGSFPPKQVDHINGNGLDNRWCNLRKVTQMENSRNMRLQVNNVSGCPGVHYCNRAEQYVARIGDNNKRIPLGYFIDWFEAICARKSAENKYGYHENHGMVRPL